MAAPEASTAKGAMLKLKNHLTSLVDPGTSELNVA